MYRHNYPDLDVLDSPILSPTPISAFGGVPGSALAERIFNDPQSWEQGNENDDDIPSDPMTWFVEEIEKFRANSAATDATFSRNQDDALRDKIRLMPSPVSARSKRDSQLKGIKRASVRPISLAALFDRPGDEFTKDVHAHLTKLIESGGGPPGMARAFPSAAFSSLSSGSSGSTMSPLQIPTASTDTSSVASPVAIYSASTTLSFLEWYGIYPDSPRMDPNFRKSILARSRSRNHPPSLQVPSPKSAHPRRSSLLSSTPSRANFDIDPIKRVSSVPPPTVVQPSADEQDSVKDLSPIVSPDVRPSTPPGLSRSQAPVTQSSAVDTSASRQPIEVLPPHKTLYPTAPPPYARTPSPSFRLILSELPTRSLSPPQYPTTSAAHPSIAMNPISTTVRRLPTIPPESGGRPAASSWRGLPSSSYTSPLPSSFPTSPDRGSAQTLIMGARPLSAVRSPLGGPAGPRSRASTGSRNPSLSKASGRCASGLGHRPPVLQL